MTKPWFLTFALLAACATTGCSSTPTTVFPRPPANYEVLGHAEGTGRGSLGFLSTAYYFIPLGINSRTERAYQAAVSSVPGATGLINVMIKESWWWWLIGTGRTVTITGDAIREKN